MESHTLTIEDINSADNERLVTRDEAENERQEILDLESIPTEADAANAAKRLSHLVLLREVHESGMYPLSGATDWSKEPNPSDDDLQHAAETMAGFSLERKKLAHLAIETSQLDIRADDEGVLYPLDVRGAGDLVDVAKQTQDPQAIAIAHAALEDIRNKGEGIIADELQYGLHDTLGILTDEEIEEHRQLLKKIDEQEKYLLDATEQIAREEQKAKRIEEVPSEYQQNLQEDDAIPYDPFALD